MVLQAIPFVFGNFRILLKLFVKWFTFLRLAIKIKRHVEKLFDGKERFEFMDQSCFMFEELNPTFLFTWKGVGNRDDSYHSHDYLELIVVMSGCGKYRIEGEIYNVKEGDVLLLNPSDKHQALPLEAAETPSREFIIGFHDVQMHGYEKNYLPLAGGRNIIHTSGELKQRILKICTSMEAENTVDKQGRYYMLKAYLMQLLILLLREQTEPMKDCQGRSFESINKKYVVEQILNYFEDHYNEKVSLDRIAENMYLSPFYISKIFKSETGATPIRHLINIRLEKAREILMEDQNMSIQEVAACVGYDDAYHFSKLYKKHFGVSPSYTRKQDDK